MASIGTPVPSTPVESAPITPVTGVPTAPVTTTLPEPTTMEEAFNRVLPPPSSAAAPAPPTETSAQPATTEPQPAQPTTPPEVVPPTDEPIEGPDSQDAEGKRWFFSKSKGERLIAASKALRDFRELVPDLTPDSFREMVGRANAAQVMMSTYHRAADPNISPQDRYTAMNDIVGYFAEQSPVALGFLAIEAQGQLAKLNPQAYQAIQQRHTSQLVQGLQGRISQIVDPAKKMEEVAFIQNLELRLTGRFTPTDQLMSGIPAQQPPANDPRNAQLQQREQRINDWERQRQQESATFLENNIGMAIGTAQRGAVESSLSAVKGRLNDLQYDYLVKALLQEVANAELAHPEWAEQHNALYMQAKLTGAPADISRVAKYREQIAQRVIRTQGPAVVSKFMGPVGSQSNGAGVPAQRPNEPSITGTATAANPNGIDRILKADNWDAVFKAAGLR